LCQWLSPAIHQAPRQHAADFAFHGFIDFTVGFVNGGENHVLKQLDVTFLDGFGIDLKRNDL